MFTGLIEEVGQLQSARETPQGRELTIQSNLSAELSIGQSISINGACLSVTDHASDTFTVMAVPETIAKTTLGQLQPNNSLNLERCLVVGSRLDGHIVQGHIDTTSLITRVSEDDGTHLYELLIPEEHAELVVARGSVAIDGISLTIARLFESHITVAIIPHTWQHTNVRSWQRGTRCNLEFDILAKYAVRLMNRYQKS